MNSISFIAQTVDRALNNESTNPSQIIPKDPSNTIKKPSLESQGESIIDLKDSNKQDVSHPNIDDHDNANVKESTLNFIIRLILFIPNLLIIRPLLFTWFIITFPLNLLERKNSGSNDDESNDNTDNNDNDKKNDLNNELNTNENNDNNSDDNKETTKDEPPSDNEPPSDSEPSSLTPSPSLSPELTSQHSNTTIPELDEETESISPNHTTAIDLKSPTSPTSSTLSPLNSKFLTFPKFVFPRSLINSNNKKTLILDLDETLVHSLSRGTRMSNGHMVEVKLNNQVATLYYVHKRPYCDLFLKQVSKWYNLVIFTASVKEYADPVIDWLESERKYFNKRYYRNHCTLRDGQGYIKDLSNVDKNLQNVLIIDNSPISYALHENNAIIVEGWINDPSDSDLLNLIPLLNGLRYTTDVRSILSLKNGEVALEK